ncbi:hypothetical protein CRG98_000759 [Punica granatum]|uniref:Uncharacterized protein n=1 Tax=Punica granatum TaxID=22663 RepID=A0A2I0LDS7_PUNGR|nr:hypothetical protein CRG98_000759 [Punica granatum]
MHIRVCTDVGCAGRHAGARGWAHGRRQACGRAGMRAGRARACGLAHGWHYSPESDDSSPEMH